MSDSDTPHSPRPAVILLSGGLDSATVGAIARHEGFALHALSVDYGQRHRFELESAARVAATLGVVEHRVLQIDLAALGGSALTADIDVPQGRTDEQISDGIPVTYVPARNTVMLSLALAYAEVVGAADVFIGVNAVDYSGYPDCRPEFIDAFQRLANLATKAGVEGSLKFKIHTPLVKLTKAQIIRRGLELGVDYSLTHSCYAPDATGAPCGRCDACQLRLKGFAEAGVEDPVQYSADAPQRTQRAQSTEEPRADLNRLSRQVVDAAIAVHKRLGPGLLESAYEACLCQELASRGIPFQRQASLPIEYDGVRLECGYRLDVVVAGVIILELKSVEQVLPIHQAQLLSYLKLSQLPLGLLLNFNVPLMKQGITRLAN